MGRRSEVVAKASIRRAKKNYLCVPLMRNCPPPRELGGDRLDPGSMLAWLGAASEINENDQRRFCGYIPELPPPPPPPPRVSRSDCGLL